MDAREIAQARARRSGAIAALLAIGGGLAGGFALAVMSPGLWENNAPLFGAGAAAIACGLLGTAALISIARSLEAPADAAGAVQGVAPRTRARDLTAGLSGQPIDESALEALLRLGDEDFVEEVATQFSAEGTLLLLKIAGAVSESDPAEFAAQIHALRSSAANVGAQRLYRLCLEWRETAPDELATTGSARFVLLQKEFEAAQKALRNWRDRRPRRVTPGARAG